MNKTIQQWHQKRKGDEQIKNESAEATEKAAQ
jgi:hypothetical protein